MSEARKLKTLHKCFVPNCPNSGSKTKDKLFVHVSRALKRKWCEDLNIEYNPEKKMYCCEDHLNLKEDLDNYHQWKLMKANPRLKPTATLKYAPNNVQLETVNDDTSIEENTNSLSELQKLLLQPTENVSTQGKYYRSCTTTSTNAGLLQISVATQCESVRMVDKYTMVNKHVLKPKPIIGTDIESSPTITPTISETPSLYGGTTETDVSDSDKQISEKTFRLLMIRLIYKYPKMYLGLPKHYIFIIKEIVEIMSVKENDVLVALVKIKLNDSMERLGHQFDLLRSAITTSFFKGVLASANYFQNYVFMPSPQKIKENLPEVFKIRYSYVQCILDAFEIEIEKPSNPESQAQTWSQYKNCNTIKYLVGSTPNGFISYISKGYGGRISDKALVEISDLISVLPINAVVMTDRGFKEIEPLFMSKNIRLCRPPSVYSSTKPTQEDVLKTKVIASLRIHIERVIRRIREFRLLKPHSVVNHQHVAYLNNVLLIACGLINLQNEIIKRQ